MMIPWKRLTLAWGAFHFFAILIGVLQMEKVIVQPSLFGRLMSFYGRISGARGGFAFFSVNVPNQLAIEFLVEEPHKVPYRLLLDDYFFPEMSIRYHRMVRVIESRFADPEMRRAVSASLAAYVLDRWSEAEKVTLIAKVILTTNLSDYRGGPVNQETEVYRATFSRTGEGSPR